MTWFEPSTMEPLYKFELIGMLISLAVYNGLTLPCTFPRALYMKLLNITVRSLAHLEDGWPDLVKGLTELSNWSGGAVEDVFARSYAFSFEVFGAMQNVDLEAARRRSRMKSISNHADGSCVKEAKASTKSTNPPARLVQEDHPQRLPQQGQHPELEVKEDDSPPSSTTLTEVRQMDAIPSPKRASKTHPRASSTTSEIPMVTDANKHQYIQDYIWYLTDTSIAPQFKAFARGFTSCISPKTLSLFTPSNLKRLVEGDSFIDTYALQSITSYEGGYYPLHHTIMDFWEIVHGWARKDGEEGQLKVRHLLEFVTASDRLPLTGTARLVFVVQKNGIGNERLPTSLTCFGRLLLPEFSDWRSLRKGLEKAIENSKGFGQP